MTIVSAILEDTLINPLAYTRKQSSYATHRRSANLYVAGSNLYRLAVGTQLVNKITLIGSACLDLYIF